MAVQHRKIYISLNLHHHHHHHISVTVLRFLYCWYKSTDYRINQESQQWKEKQYKSGYEIRMHNTVLVPPKRQHHTRQAKGVQRNFEVLASNHCCCGKERSITCSEYEFVALFIQHAQHLCQIILCLWPILLLFLFHHALKLCCLKVLAFSITSFHRIWS